MRKALVHHIFVACFAVLLLQLCAPSLSFCKDRLPDIELAEQSETDREANESERLKIAEELTDRVPAFEIGFIPIADQQHKITALVPLQETMAEVPVPPPDSLLA